MNMEYLDKITKGWESDPMKIERAFILANEIKRYIKPDKSLNAFELGCGTGILGYFLKDDLCSITLADSSEETIGALKERIDDEHFINLQPLLIDLVKQDAGAKQYDLIFTLMTLHHIADLDTIMTKFSKMLRSNGHLCIADLEKEDGTFHENMANFEGYHGFERADLGELLHRYGLRIHLYKTFYEIKKTMNDGNIKVFPLFMLIAQR